MSESESHISEPQSTSRSRQFLTALKRAGRMVGIGIVLLVVIAGGSVAAGVLGVPSPDRVDNTFGEVTNETTEIHSVVHLDNPNPFGLPLGAVGVAFEASMNEVPMASGTVDNVSIVAGNSTIELTTRMNNTVIPDFWAGHIERGESTDINIDADLILERFGWDVSVSHTHPLETDLLDGFDSDEQRPISSDHPVASDPMLYVNETHARWLSVDGHVTPIEKTFVMYNPNLEPYALSELRYELILNDQVVATGATDNTVVIESGQEERIVGTTDLDANALDRWWVSHLDEETHGHQVSELRLEFEAVIRLPTDDEITIPMDAFTVEELIETDVFDERIHEERDGPDADDSADHDDEADDADDTSGDTTDDGTDNDADDTDGSTDDGTDNDTDDTDGSTDDETANDADYDDDPSDDDEDDNGLPL